MVKIMSEREIQNPFEKARMERLDFISDYLKKTVPIDREKVSAMIQFRYGTSHKTAKELLRAVMAINDYEFNPEGLIIKKVL